MGFKILRSHSDAEEAVSQTFLKIIDHIDKISKLPCPQIAPYCVVIVKNESVNILRKRKKVINVEELEHFGNGNYSDIEEEFLKITDKEQLLLSVNRLSDKEKYLIHLHFVDNMSYKKIANLLGVNEETAKKRCQRILKKLRALYKEGERNV